MAGVTSAGYRPRWRKIDQRGSSTLLILYMFRINSTSLIAPVTIRGGEFAASTAGWPLPRRNATRDMFFRQSIGNCFQFTRSLLEPLFGNGATQCRATPRIWAACSHSRFVRGSGRTNRPAKVSCARIRTAKTRPYQEALRVAFTAARFLPWRRAAGSRAALLISQHYTRHHAA